jgi:hypothetical protein
VSSTWGKGSTFFAVLPRYSETSSAVLESATPGELPVSDPRAPSILIIEDEPKDQNWLGHILTGAGYNVAIAGTGAKAIALCREKAFDAITLDLILPDISGWDLVRKIRSEGPNQRAPIIVVTVVADKAAAMGFRVQDFLTKPVTEVELLAAIRGLSTLQDGSKKVLCVDDDPPSLKLAAAMLQKAGFVPICETDARAALKRVEEEHPAAVILDLLMPDMDGFQFLEQFRKMPAGYRVPVIVWTVKDLTRKERARLASAQAIVLKDQGGASQLIEELGAHIGRPQPINRAKQAGKTYGS